jgi:3-dehydroquinate synthase
MSIPSFSRCTVNVAGGHYDISIGHNLIKQNPASIFETIRDNIPTKIFVIADEALKNLCLPSVVEALQSFGAPIHTLLIPSGEKTKSFAGYKELMERLLDLKPDRKCLIVALGGGVTGDLAGFAASTLLRGLRLIQIPTSLLSQVDSSIGGKTGINTPHGKNLIGTFWHPEHVIIDTCFLKTLSERQMKAGYAEIVKYALIRDADFFSWLEKEAHNVIKAEQQAVEYAILKSCKIKVNIVKEDERDITGIRAVLNLGHTFGHAIEAFANYGFEKVVHGEAVITGIHLAFQTAVKLGLCPLEDSLRVTSHLKETKIYTEIKDFFPDRKDTYLEIIRLMGADKKSDGGRLYFVLPRKIGDALLYDTPVHKDIIHDIITPGIFL